MKNLMIVMTVLFAANAFAGEYPQEEKEYVPASKSFYKDQEVCDIKRIGMDWEVDYDSCRIERVKINYKPTGKENNGAAKGNVQPWDK